MMVDITDPDNRFEVIYSGDVNNASLALIDGEYTGVAWDFAGQPNVIVHITEGHVEVEVVS